LDLGLFRPELTLIATAIAIVLLDLFIERKGWLAFLSIIGLAVSAGFTIAMRGTFESTFYDMLTVDGFALFFKLLFLGIVALVILASTDYVSKFARFQGEYYALILLSALGMMLMASARELISIYISLELTSIPLYALAGFLKDKKSSESSLKYLLLGAMSSAVLLYGMALTFGITGETQLDKIAGIVQGMPQATASTSPRCLRGSTDTSSRLPFCGQ
jgi:NADH-quinone oxidoreductase subunit N